MKQDIFLYINRYLSSKIGEKIFYFALRINILNSRN